MQRIRVYANPYAALDGHGQPHAVVQMFDIVNGRLTMLEDRYVGARPDPVALVKTGKRCFTFELDADGRPTIQTLPWMAFYAKAIQEGELIAADWETAQMAGISEADFTKGLERLDIEKTIAAEAWRARYGARPSWSASPASAPRAPAPKTNDAPLDMTAADEEQI